jgi:hypothetical protein
VSGANNEYMMIDATIVRAHQHSAWRSQKTATKLSVDRVAGRRRKFTPSSTP